MSFIKNNIGKAFAFLLIILIAGKATAQSFSDEQLKKNIAPINNPLNSLRYLQPRSFEFDQARYKNLGLMSGRQYGFLAENMETVFPDLVNKKNISYMYGKNSYRTAVIKSVDLNSLIPVLVAAINEQQAQIEALKADVQRLKEKR